jgi:hypothetical protein
MALETNTEEEEKTRTIKTMLYILKALGKIEDSVG